MESYIFIWTCLTCACVHSYCNPFTRRHDSLSFYCSRAVNREYEVDITRSTTCFKRKIFIFCNIWRKRRLAFAVHYALNRVCKTEQMEFAWVHQSHLLRAHQIWFTHRGILAMPVIHIHLLLTEAHNQTEGKTNTEHGLVNTRHLWVTSAFWMTVKSAPNLSFPCSLPLQIHSVSFTLLSLPFQRSLWTLSIFSSPIRAQPFLYFGGCGVLS